jgi:hypothetical protein
MQSLQLVSCICLSGSERGSSDIQAGSFKQSKVSKACRRLEIEIVEFKYDLEVPSSKGDLPIYRAENTTEKMPVSAQPPRRVLPTTLLPT